MRSNNEHGTKQSLIDEQLQWLIPRVSLLQSSFFRVVCCFVFQLSRKLICDLCDLLARCFDTLFACLLCQIESYGCRGDNN